MHLRLVVVVPVGARRCVERDAGLVLPREAGPRLGERGVGLQREHRPRVQDLEQIGQPPAEEPDIALSQDLDRRRGNQRVEPHGRAVDDDGGGRPRVSAEPELRERQAAGIRLAEQARDELPAAPVVVLHGAVEREQAGSRGERADGRGRVGCGGHLCLPRESTVSSLLRPRDRVKLAACTPRQRFVRILKTWRDSASERAAGSTPRGPASCTRAPTGSTTWPSTRGSIPPSRSTSGSGRSRHHRRTWNATGQRYQTISGSRSRLRTP